MQRYEACKEWVRQLYNACKDEDWVFTVPLVLLAAAADLLTGRRGLLATSLVSATGAVCGWFLAVRVFALAITDSWTWVPWAMGGAMFCLLAFFLFRSKR